jgi:hypothetical protein
MPQTRQSVGGGLLDRHPLSAVRDNLGGRGGLLALAAIALVGGLALNWNWLAAVGVAPLLLAVLPCVAMCALGLCMKRTTGRTCSSETASDSQTHSQPTVERNTTDA